MRTECKQARFEFHGLFQRKVKARFDGGKITSDAGVLLLREVEQRTGLVAGLTACFRDHRDPRLIEHTVDDANSWEEERILVLGRSDSGRKLFIVCAVRNSLIRVISARDMTKKEREVYLSYG